MTYLKTLLADLFGAYSPVITTLQDGTEVVQYDIEYIASAIIFLILIWSLLRIIGGLICNR